MFLDVGDFRKKCFRVGAFSLFCWLFTGHVWHPGVLLRFGVHGLVCSRLDLLWFPSLPAMIRGGTGFKRCFSKLLSLLCDWPGSSLYLFSLPLPLFIPSPLFNLRSSPENFVLIDIWLFLVLFLSSHGDKAGWCWVLGFIHGNWGTSGRYVRER